MTKEQRPLPETSSAPLLIRVDAVYACFSSLLGFYFGHPNLSHAKEASTLEDQIRRNVSQLPDEFQAVILSDMVELNVLLETEDEKAASALIKARQKEIIDLLKAI